MLALKWIFGCILSQSWVRTHVEVRAFTETLACIFFHLIPCHLCTHACAFARAHLHVAHMYVWLERYAPRLLELGYDDPSTWVGMTVGELDEMADESGMLPGHRQKLANAIRNTALLPGNLQASSGEGPGSGGGGSGSGGGGSGGEGGGRGRAAEEDCSRY